MKTTKLATDIHALIRSGACQGKEEEGYAILTIAKLHHLKRTYAERAWTRAKEKC